jgi:hypothetical protein
VIKEARVAKQERDQEGDSSVSRKEKPDIAQSMNSPIDRILHLQTTIGNQAVQRLLKTGVIQAKMKIGQPNDRNEQEAEQASEQLILTSTPGGLEHGKGEDAMQAAPIAARAESLSARGPIHPVRHALFTSAPASIQRQSLWAKRSAKASVSSVRGNVIISAAKKRIAITKNFRGKKYMNYKHYARGTGPGWFYSPNAGLGHGYAAYFVPSCLKQQGVNPPSAQYVVDWAGDIEPMIKRYTRSGISPRRCPVVLRDTLHLCNVFTYDSLYDAGYKGINLSSVRHYFGPQHDNRKSGIFGKRLVIYKNVLPGDVFVLGRFHMGSVLKKESRGRVRTLDTWPNYGENVRSRKSMKFLRAK